MHTQTADVSALLYARAALLAIVTEVGWYDARAVGSLMMASRIAPAAAGRKV